MNKIKLGEALKNSIENFKYGFESPEMFFNISISNLIMNNLDNPLFHSLYSIIAETYGDEQNEARR